MPYILFVLNTKLTDANTGVASDSNHHEDTNTLVTI